MQNNTFFEDSTPGNIIVFEELPSTNDYLKELLSKVKPLDPYTVIMTKNQTAGKGQRGNQWKSAPNQNLTASFLLTPENLPIAKQFLMTIVSSLTVYNALLEFIPKNLTIKWPNDILINNKKVAGILIENKISQGHIKNCIVGIGINVLQTNFPEEIQHKTSSLVLENPKDEFDILYIAKMIQKNLKYYMNQLIENEDNLIKQYNQKLFNRGLKKSYIFKNKEIIGNISKVDIDGLLQIEIHNIIHKVDLKGISYIL